MTDERTMDERSSNDGDARVTRAYRDLGAVTSPARLDELILRRAKRAASPRYARLRLWTRPVAWAATIGLSLAIVLQLNEGVLQPQEELAPASAAPAEAAKKSFAKHSDDAGSVGRAEADLEQKLERAGLPSEGQAVVPADVDLVKEAADMARMQSGEQQRPAVAPASAVTVSAELAHEAVEQHCDDQARATSETWLECIAALEEQGLEDEAMLERAAYNERFRDR